MNVANEFNAALYTETYLPNAGGKKAFVLPGSFYSATVHLMAEAGYTKASNWEEADVIVFIGGTDIDPSFYGQTRHGLTQRPDSTRDTKEEAIFRQARNKRIPMFGICRGAQLLAALNGHLLWQHVDGHDGEDHDIVDLEEGFVLSSNSLHHQMIRYETRDNAQTDLSILAVTNTPVATHFLDATTTITESTDLSSPFAMLEIEAGYFHSSRCFFVQGHPELGSPEFRSWTMNKLADLLYEWETYELEDSGPPLFLTQSAKGKLN